MWKAMQGVVFDLILKGEPDVLRCRGQQDLRSLRVKQKGL